MKIKDWINLFRSEFSQIFAQCLTVYENSGNIFSIYFISVHRKPFLQNNYQQLLSKTSARFF